MTTQAQATTLVPEPLVYLPGAVAVLADPETDIPRIAKDPGLFREN